MYVLVWGQVDKLSCFSAAPAWTHTLRTVSLEEAACIDSPPIHFLDVLGLPSLSGVDHKINNPIITGTLWLVVLRARRNHSAPAKGSPEMSWWLRAQVEDKSYCSRLIHGFLALLLEQRLI